MISHARRILLLAIRLCVVAVLVACVCLSLVPRFAISSASASCCVGKSAGHCSVSLRKARKAPKPEPMCGLKPTPSSEDNITVVADENEDTSNPQTAFTSPDHCRECPTCSLVSKQRTRDKSFIPIQQPIRQDSNLALLFEAHHDSFRPRLQFKLISSRGPPLS